MSAHSTWNELFYSTKYLISPIDGIMSSYCDRLQSFGTAFVDQLASPKLKIFNFTSSIARCLSGIVHFFQTSCSDCQGSLLVDWLSKVVYFQEIKSILRNSFKLKISCETRTIMSVVICFILHKCRTYVILQKKKI